MPIGEWTSFMSRLTDRERKDLMDDIRSFDELIPCMGTFWYDAGTRAISHIRKMGGTPSMIEEARQKGQTSICYLNEDGLMNGNIIWDDDKFIVLVGKWAVPICEELTELLKKEFSLPCFEFMYDEY